MQIVHDVGYVSNINSGLYRSTPEKSVPAGFNDSQCNLISFPADFISYLLLSSSLFSEGSSICNYATSIDVSSIVNG